MIGGILRQSLPHPPPLPPLISRPPTPASVSLSGAAAAVWGGCKPSTTTETLETQVRLFLHYLPGLFSPISLNTSTPLSVPIRGTPWPCTLGCITHSQYSSLTFPLQTYLHEVATSHSNCSRFCASSTSASSTCYWAYFYTPILG